MSRKKKTQVERVDFSTILWCIDNLTTEQMSAHDKKPLSGDELLHKIHELVEADFKVTVKFDTYSGGYMCTAICDVVGSRNEALAISSRGDDITDALSILMYKYFDVAETDLRPHSNKPKGVRG